MNILICDDESIICESITGYIKNNFSHKPYSCSNKNEVIEYMHNFNINLLIIDIVLKDDNGIEIAREAKGINPNLDVIFITGYGNIYYNNIFDGIDPKGFLDKPIQYNILNFFIKQIQSIYEKNHKKLVISYDFNEYIISAVDIIYIQSTKRLCEIFTKNEIFRCYKKLSDIQNELPEGFVRCHQSYIINSKYIKSHQTNQFTLKNGTIIPISNSYAKKIKDLFLKKAGG